MTANAVAIGAAMSVAKDLAEGRLSTDQLQAETADVCRALVGTVVGPDDASGLWELQLEIARGILAVRGIPADELVEWLAVARRGATVDTEIQIDATGQRQCKRGRRLMSAELVAVAAALFGGATNVGPFELQVTRTLLDRHNLRAVDVAKWFAVRSVMPVRCIDAAERIN